MGFLIICNFVITSSDWKKVNFALKALQFWEMALFFIFTLGNLALIFSQI
jgi:hypothetical protein